MQEIWNGDRRDRVKWGALLHLARVFPVCEVLHVAFLKKVPLPVLEIENGEVPLAKAVWRHFGDLHRVVGLGSSFGVTISVFDRPFESRTRDEYVDAVIAALSEAKPPRLVFLDPDTGIAPSGRKAVHVTEGDVSRIWRSLAAGDLLVVYQHSDRSKTGMAARKNQFSRACDKALPGVIRGSRIAKDVSILWARKNGSA